MVGLDEQLVMELRPSKMLALDKWITGGAIALIWPVLAVQVTAIAELEAPQYSAWPTWAITSGVAFLPSLCPIVWALWKTIVLRCIVYQVTTQRIIRRSGVLSRVYDEIELVRVRDFEIFEPFYLRLLGLGHLRVYTAENNTPIITLRGQEQVVRLRDALRTLVIERQRLLGYREVGVGGGI